MSWVVNYFKDQHLICISFFDIFVNLSCFTPMFYYFIIIIKVRKKERNVIFLKFLFVGYMLLTEKNLNFNGRSTLLKYHIFTTMRINRTFSDSLISWDNTNFSAQKSLCLNLRILCTFCHWLWIQIFLQRKFILIQSCNFRS